MTWLSVDVDALFVFPAISCTFHAFILAVTTSLVVIPVTVNSKLVPLFGATSVGPEVTVPVVQVSVMSPELKVPVFIASSKTTLKVALSTAVGSTWEGA